MRVGLEAGVTDYIVVLTGEPAIEVSGIVVDEHKRPIKDVMIVARYANYGTFRTNRVGEFHVPLVAKETDNELFIKTYPRVTIVPISKEQSRRDVRLDPIEIPTKSPGPTGQALLRVHDNVTPGGGATLISTDGTLIFSYISIRGGGLAVQPTDEPGPVILPVGKYYVAPGTFLGWNYQLSLLDAIRNGVDLSATDVSHVTVNEDGVAEIDFSAADAKRAIESLESFKAEYELQTRP